MNNHESRLQVANRMFRELKYCEALEIYNSLLTSEPQLVRTIGFNIRLAQCRLNRQGKLANIENKIGVKAKESTPRLKKTLLGIYDIQGLNGLEEKSDQSWQSTSEDPYYLLDPKQLFKRGGPWYLLELAIQGPRKNQISRLYIDIGNGFNEIETINIFSERNKLTSRVLHLNTPPKAIRFDPMDIPGELAIHIFHVRPLDSAEAQQLMLERVIEKKLPHTQGKPEVAMCIIRNKAQEAKQETMQYLYDWYSTILVPKHKKVEYADWIQAVETPSLPSVTVVENALATMRNKPVISVVIPVYNTPEIYLRSCIDSVLAQSYPYWELCIADDCSTDLHVPDVLAEYAAKDSRIRYTRCQTNGHISLASNSALDLALGDFVALLDHDDLLAKDALYFMAHAINANPEAVVIYSDEDKIDAYGNRSEPHFKSDWNPDLFFSQNYVSHLGVYRRKILQTIGGFRQGVEGSQDQDLLLRCLPYAKHNQIIHIPRILYHWRALEGSTALAAGEKSYTTEAGLKALRDYFETNGPQGIRVEVGMVENTYNVRWPLPEPSPLVSLLIPTRDKKELIEVAVRSILDKTTYSNYEILILDNGSVESETHDWFASIQQEDSRVRVIRYDHPFNYSAINNFGVGYSKGSIIGLINNDIEVITPEWLTVMVGHACRKDIGCVGAKLYYSNNTVQHAGVILGIGGVAGHSHKHIDRESLGYFSRLVLTQSVSAVTAACLIVRREVYNEVCGLDEENLKVAFNDIDFCLRVREAGYRNLLTPYAELYHYESISRGHEDTPEKRRRFQKEVEFMKSRWGYHLKNDPYYSPHLTIAREDFSIEGDVDLIEY